MACRAEKRGKSGPVRLLELAVLKDAVNHGGLAQRGVEEGVAVEDGQVCVLAGLKRAQARG